MDANKMFADLKPRDVINYNGWPCRVDSVPSEGPIVVQSLGADDLRQVGPEILRCLQLEPETLRMIGRRANILELMDVA